MFKIAGRRLPDPCLHRPPGTVEAFRQLLPEENSRPGREPDHQGAGEMALARYPGHRFEMVVTAVLTNHPAGGRCPARVDLPQRRTPKAAGRPSAGTATRRATVVAGNRGVGKWFVNSLILITVLWLALPAAAVELVVNPSVTDTSLTRAKVRAIFNMRLLSWPDGTPIRVFVLKDRDPLHREFSKRVLQVFPYQLRRAWDRRVYSGVGQAPQQVSSVEEMKRRLADTPGAIGYLPEDRIDDSVRKIDLQ